MRIDYGTICLREATEGDWARLYAWRIDPTVQENAQSTGDFQIDQHMAWLRAALADPQRTRIFIAYSQVYGAVKGGAIGMGRLDHDGGDVVALSLVIDPGVRGKGYGIHLVGALVRAAGLCFPTVPYVEAIVLATNTASLRAF